MAFDSAFLKPFHFDTVQFTTCHQVAHFKSEAVIDTDENQGFRAVHRKRTNVMTEGSAGLRHRVSGVEQRDDASAERPEGGIMP